MAAHDAKGNTFLHRLFWLAVTTNDAQLSNQVTAIGIQLLTTLKTAGSGEFRKALTIQNNHGETFLQNIYLTATTQGAANAAHLNNVQQAIGPLLESFKTKKAATDVVDFYKKPFKTWLEELLSDVTTYTVMTNPMLLVTEGHTCDKTTWDAMKKNPFTNNVFKKSDLKEHHFLKQIITLFNKNNNNHVTYQELKNLLDKQTTSQSDVYMLDVTLTSIKLLVEAYEAHLQELKTPAGAQKQLAISAEKIAGNIKLVTANPQEKKKRELLGSLAQCLKASANFTSKELSAGMGLLRAICNTKTGFSIFSAPASAAEFTEAVAHLSVVAKDDYKSKSLTELETLVKTFIGNVNAARNNNNNSNNNGAVISA